MFIGVSYSMSFIKIKEINFSLLNQSTCSDNANEIQGFWKSDNHYLIHIETLIASNKLQN